MSGLTDEQWEWVLKQDCTVMLTSRMCNYFGELFYNTTYDYSKGVSSMFKQTAKNLKV